ncbi:MAG TPA: hypothetical protein VJO16_18895 [Candidatus Acidoferrum sp.]|nr:hypothetical protein [Candidatus Acidoferrum sp.]
MKTLNVRIILPIAALLLMAGTIPARAQAPLEATQMSPRTLFYVIWRGVPGADARKANSLLALWDDADFAPVRSAMAAGLLNSATEKSGEKSAQTKLTPEQVQELAGLLENSFTMGYVSEPVRRNLSNGAVSADSRLPAWNGMFFVYDRAGKELLLAKTMLRLRAADKEAPTLSQVTIGGAQVLKSEGKGGVSYWADHGKYAIATGEPTVMEELLGRLDKKASGTATLAQSAAYQEAQSNLGGGLLEFFLRVPDIKELAADSKAGMFQTSPLLQAARIDAVHSIGGRVTFEGARTHVQAAVLGDAVEGTPFDIWSAGKSTPVSLALVPADAVFYNSTQFNFSGIYATVKRVAKAAFPQAQQGNVDMFEAIGQQKLGRPPAEAIALLTGEVATLQTSPMMDTAKQVYFFGIRKKAEALKLIRTIAGEQLGSERNEGDVTFLKLSMGGKQGTAGSAQWNFFHLAVTPDMIIAASRSETLKEVLATRANGTADGGIATVPQFKANRAKYPENLNSLSYLDFQKIDWQGMKDRWIEEAKKSPTAKAVSFEKDGGPSTAADWLSLMKPQVFARHLHFSSSVSWKDAKGIHWDQWVE